MPQIYSTLAQEADAILSGKLSPEDKSVVRVPVSARGIPRSVWRRFSIIARQKEMTIPQALVDALVTWCKLNSGA